MSRPANRRLIPLLFTFVCVDPFPDRCDVLRLSLYWRLLLGSTGRSYGVSTKLVSDLVQPPDKTRHRRLQQSPEGEWWELSDQTRGGRSYFYRKRAARFRRPRRN
jgi:hypothetical protein